MTDVRRPPFALWASEGRQKTEVGSATVPTERFDILNEYQDA